MIFKGQHINYVMGIDPGLSGAIAFFKLEYKNRQYQTICEAVYDMPTMRGSTFKKSVRVTKISEWMNEYGFMYGFLEKVGAMPKQGVTSMFTFGRGVGMLEATLQLKEVPYNYVTPQSWKREFDLIGKPKEAALERAANLVRGCDVELSKKSHTGRADAMLIGLYGAQKIMEAVANIDR